MTPVGCKKGTCESLSQIKDKKIMFSLAQVTEVAESKAAGTHVFKHHVCEVTMEMILQGSRVLL